MARCLFLITQIGGYNNGWPLAAEGSSERAVVFEETKLPLERQEAQTFKIMNFFLHKMKHETNTCTTTTHRHSQAVNGASGQTLKADEEQTRIWWRNIAKYAIFNFKSIQAAEVKGCVCVWGG